jgi:hypothetical protein
LRQLQTPLATLAVSDGYHTSASPYIFTAGVEHAGARGATAFFAILEPLTEHQDNDDLAPLVLNRLASEVASRHSITATAAINAAVEEINAELAGYNQSRPERERLYFGLTCGLTRGDDLYLAQVPPSQVLIGQDGDVYAFPGLESWHWSLRSETNTALEQPLGLHEEIEPDLYHTRIEAGDLIVLASPSLARVIQREPQDVFLSGNAEAAIAHLRELAHDYAVESAAAATIAILPGPAASSSRNLSLRNGLSGLVSLFLPRSEKNGNHRNSSAQGVDRLAQGVQTRNQREADPRDPSRTSSHSTSDGAGRTSDKDASDERYAVESGSGPVYEDLWDPTRTRHNAVEDAESPETWDWKGRRTLTEILAGVLLALSAAVVGVWQLAINRDRQIDDDRRSDSTVGVPRLERYDSGTQRRDFSSVRRRLPRAPISPLTGIISATLVIGLAGMLAFSVHTSRERERTEMFESRIIAAAQSREQAVLAADPVVASAHLSAAEARLTEAEALGIGAERIAAERALIAEARDVALGIERLGAAQTLGMIPAAPEGVSPKLFVGNGQLYVFTDALYLLDAEQSRLVRLIGPGDLAAGHSVGMLLGAGWGHGNPVVVDSTHAYLFEPSVAAWTSHQLGLPTDGSGGIAGVSGFIGNLYLLTPGSGQIMRYADGLYAGLPDDWTAGQAAEELRRGVDLIVDGRIYVLLDDGQILNFYRGALDTTIDPQATPPIEGAVSLSSQPDRPYVYVADSHDRILRISREGEVIQQFMAAEGSTALTNIQAIAVDDALGTAYVLADSVLVQVRLPDPPR